MLEQITPLQQVNFLISSTALRTAGYRLCIPLLTCMHAHTLLHALLNIPQWYFFDARKHTRVENWLIMGVQYYKVKKES